MESALDAEQCRKSYFKAQKFYEDDDLVECIRECQEILDESECPLYYRIRSLVLLGACVDDLHESGECSRQALRLWEACRDHHGEAGGEVAAALAELKVSIDSLHAGIVRAAAERNFAPDRFVEEDAMATEARDSAAIESEGEQNIFDDTTEADKLALKEEEVNSSSDFVRKADLTEPQSAANVPGPQQSYAMQPTAGTSTQPMRFGPGIGKFARHWERQGGVE